MLKEALHTDNINILTYAFGIFNKRIAVSGIFPHIFLKVGFIKSKSDGRSLPIKGKCRGKAWCHAPAVGGQVSK